MELGVELVAIAAAAGGAATVATSPMWNGTTQPPIARRPSALKKAQTVRVVGRWMDPHPMRPMEPI